MISPHLVILVTPQFTNNSENYLGESTDTGISRKLDKLLKNYKAHRHIFTASPDRQITFVGGPVAKITIQYGGKAATLKTCCIAICRALPDFVKILYASVVGLRIWPPRYVLTRIQPVFDLSERQWAGRAPKVPGGGNGCGKGVYRGGAWKGYAPPRKFMIFFHFRIVHSGAFSYTNSKVLFAIKCRERYVITIFLTIDGDTDMKTSSFHQSRKLIPIQSVNSNSRRFHSYSRHVLWA